MLAMNNLPAAQEAMCLRMSDAVDLSQEQSEVKGLDPDLLCVYCRLTPTKMHPKSSEILPCRNCISKKQLLKRYGLTLREYGKMMEQQAGRCAICDFLFDYRKRKSSPNIDHCHRLEHVRGVLCGACNMGLGFFRDRPELLEKGVKYLTLNRVRRQWWANKCNAF